MDTLSIQVASDLHLEFYGSDVNAADLDVLIAPKAPVLALLGDIGVSTTPLYKNFLLRQADRFEKVLIVAGNHEYYNKISEEEVYHALHSAQGEVQTRIFTVEQCNDIISEICDLRPNLYFMNMRCVQMGKFNIIGTCLFSHIPEKSKGPVWMSMNDYRKAFVERPGKSVAKPSTNGTLLQEAQLLTPDHTNQYFNTQVEWLTRKAEEFASQGYTNIVLTHYTPTHFNTSHPRFCSPPGEPPRHQNHAFSTELSHLFVNNRPDLNIRAWAYGHTHYNFDQILKGTRLLSNQKGYDFEVNDAGERAKFKKDLVLCVAYSPYTHQKCRNTTTDNCLTS